MRTLISTEFSPRRLAVEESLFHCANGYLGTRGNLHTQHGPYPDGGAAIYGTYINGFYENIPLTYAETLYGFPTQGERLVNLPRSSELALTLGGESLDLFSGKVSAWRRELDMSAGVSRYQCEWESPTGRVYRLLFSTLCSFARPNLLLYEAEITAMPARKLSGNGSGKDKDAPLTIELRYGIDGRVGNFTDPSDPRLASECAAMLEAESFVVKNGCLLGVEHTLSSALRVACACRAECLKVARGTKNSRLAREADFFGSSEPTYSRQSNSMTSTRCFSLPAGETLHVNLYTAYSDSRREVDPASKAIGSLEAAIAAGSEQIHQEQRAVLDSFWSRSAVEINAAESCPAAPGDGNPSAQEALDFALYSLLQSAGSDCISQIASKGLSGEGYEGHYFWDTEIYMLPFFILTEPERAKKLLLYRYHILPQAKANARLLGYKKGAQYSWRSITGPECSGYFPSGNAQLHINADIAHAFMDYYRVTGDLDFMAHYGAEVLIETARTWLEVGCFNGERFEIHGVTGPDEYSCLVNNNYYTNRAAAANLDAALTIMETLSRLGLDGEARRKTALRDEELALFARACNAMYLPHDDGLDIDAQDDTFLNLAVWDLKNTPPDMFPLLLHVHPATLYRYQVTKQADVVLAHFLYEEDVPESTLRQSFAYYEKLNTSDSSLSPCVYGVMSSRIGETEKALAYLDQCMMIDLKDTHGNTRDGLHMANQGGLYLSFIYGFAGLRIHAKGLYFRPQLPARWKNLRFKLLLRGAVLEVNVFGKGIDLIWHGSEALTVFVWGEARRLEPCPKPAATLNR